MEDAVRVIKMGRERERESYMWRKDSFSVEFAECDWGCGLLG